MEIWKQALLGYFVIINLVTFFTYGMDKRRAAKNRWRIPEKKLLGLAVIGGTPGALAGMYGFRHKTKHLKFVIGVPVILMLQVGLICLLRYY